MAGQSDVYRDRYAFNYLITICNRSDEIITLRQRFWEITDGHGETEQVGHAGLIEEQPVLYPGEAYEYNSGSQISTPWGSIEGAYEFEDSIGKRFVIGVPKLEFKAGFSLQLAVLKIKNRKISHFPFFYFSDGLISLCRAVPIPTAPRQPPTFPAYPLKMCAPYHR